MGAPFGDPPPRRRAPAELGAANGPDKIAHRIRNDESFSEHGGAAERSEAAYVAPSPFPRSWKWGWCNVATRSPEPISSSRPSPGGLLPPPRKLDFWRRVFAHLLSQKIQRNLSRGAPGAPGALLGPPVGHLLPPTKRTLVTTKRTRAFSGDQCAFTGGKRWPTGGPRSAPRAHKGPRFFFETSSQIFSGIFNSRGDFLETI